MLSSHSWLPVWGLMLKLMQFLKEQQGERLLFLLIYSTVSISLYGKNVALLVAKHLLHRPDKVVRERF